MAGNRVQVPFFSVEVCDQVNGGSSGQPDVWQTEDEWGNTLIMVNAGRSVTDITASYDVTVGTLHFSDDFRVPINRDIGGQMCVVGIGWAASQTDCLVTVQQ